MGKPKTQTYKKLTSLSFSEVGDPFQPFIYGQYNYPVKVALENNISVMMYGENGEVEYGGDMKYAFKPYNDFEARDKHYFSKFPVDVWKKYNLSEKELLEFSSQKNPRF